MSGSSKDGGRKLEMNSFSTIDRVENRTSMNYIRHESTACESGFSITASKSDSLAELARHSIFIRGFSVEGGNEITDVKPADIVGVSR
jgi:hypothetical protein